MSSSQFEGSGSWSSPLSHRLPTVSAAQALLRSSSNRAIPTGLEPLDEALSQKNVILPAQDQNQCSKEGGISRGHVTEVFGAPGCGKTTLAMGVAANALRSGHQVTWVDTGAPIVGQRLKDILSEGPTPAPTQGADETTPPPPPGSDKSPDELLRSFLHLRAGSIPHLLSLLLHPPPGFLTENTTLLVIDSMSTLFNSAYPPTTSQSSKAAAAAQREAGKDNKRLWQSNRKWSVAEDIITKLSGLAASRNIAVLLTSHATTTVQDGSRLFLRPAMSGSIWDPCVHFRIALYRSWLPVEATTEEVSGRATARLWVTGFAEVVKSMRNSSSSSSSSSGVGSEPVPFVIEETGLKALRKSPSAAKYTGPGALNSHSHPHSQRKRKLDMVTEEQGGDEYGWSAGHDDALIDTLTRPDVEEQDLF